MSSGLDAHRDGDCGWPCVYCDREEARETPVTRTSDGIDVPVFVPVDGPERDRFELDLAEERHDELLREAGVDVEPSDPENDKPETPTDLGAPR